MSVNRQGGRSEGYENLEAQQVQVTDHLLAADVPVAGKVNYAHDFDPAGGLERGEAAELVHLEALGIFAFVLPDPSKDQTAQGNADNEVELSFDDDANMIGYADNTATGTRNADGRGAGGTIEIAERIKTDPDVLVYHKPHNFQQVVDGVTGVGAGPTMHMAHYHINYRDALGGGPVADRHDELYVHHALGEHGVDNADIFQYTNFLLYWDVFEDETRR